MLGYQLKITIKNSHPPIWRRIIVPQHITFYDLDDIIEAAFGWTHVHMFGFYFKDMKFIGAPIKSDEDNADECIDEWLEVGKSFTYVYDFGDEWHHIVKVEKIVEYDERYPKVIKSKGPNMIEDCGGLWGFYEILDESEPFDMEKVNEDFKTWNLAEVYPEPALVWDDRINHGQIEVWNSLFDHLTKDTFEQMMKKYEEQEKNSRARLYVVESLEDVFNQYKKDELKMISELHGFKGYHRFNKKELAQWLKNHLLETVYMQKILRETSEDEITFFEQAIEEQGISLPDDIIGHSLLLSSYGAYVEAYDFYQIPQDVQEKYKKVCTPTFRNELNKRYDFFKYLDAAVYLYGVLSLDQLTQIYNDYEGKAMTRRQVKELALEYIDGGEPYVIKEGFLMDEDLEESDLYKYLIRIQEKYTYYMPKDRDEFMNYGMYECQEPDENTYFFVEYLQNKYRKQDPESLILFYEIQDGIRMNTDEEELIEHLRNMGCRISMQKQKREALENIRKLRQYTRMWDLKGHTLQEIQAQADKKRILPDAEGRKIIPFPSGRKVYPNELCPCGSGKKYKHCCGKKK